MQSAKFEAVMCGCSEILLGNFSSLKWYMVDGWWCGGGGGMPKSSRLPSSPFLLFSSSFSSFFKNGCMKSLLRARERGRRLKNLQSWESFACLLPLKTVTSFSRPGRGGRSLFGKITYWRIFTNRCIDGRVCWDYRIVIWLIRGISDKFWFFFTWNNFSFLLAFKSVGIFASFRLPSNYSKLALSDVFFFYLRMCAETKAWSFAHLFGKLWCDLMAAWARDGGQAIVEKSHSAIPPPSLSPRGNGYGLGKVFRTLGWFISWPGGEK